MSSCQAQRHDLFPKSDSVLRFVKHAITLGIILSAAGLVTV